MRRKPLVATVLVGSVMGTALALLAPAAGAAPTAGTEGSPGNRGWVAGSTHTDVPGNDRSRDD